MCRCSSTEVDRTRRAQLFTVCHIIHFGRFMKIWEIKFVENWCCNRGDDNRYRSDCHIHFARAKLNCKCNMNPLAVIMFVGYYFRSSLVTNFVGHNFRHFFIVISLFMTDEYFYPTYSCSAGINNFPILGPQPLPLF